LSSILGKIKLSGCGCDNFKDIRSPKVPEKLKSKDIEMIKEKLNEIIDYLKEKLHG